MPQGRLRVARAALSVVVATALACVTFGAVASSAFAGGDRDRDSYTANISPASAPAGKSTTFDVALTNTSSSGQGLASAALTPPLGFRVTHASLPPNATGKVYVILNVVVLDRVNVAPGSTLHVSVTATAPNKCSWPFDRWFSVASGPGYFPKLLRLDSSNSSLTTPVTCAVATGLKFLGQPNDALISSVITGTANDPSGPPVTVELVDSSGNAVTTTGTPVTIALGNNPGSKATLGGTLTEDTVNGVARFTDLSLDTPNNGYTLTAAAAGLTSDTSSSFNENNSATPCPSGVFCTHTITSGSGSLQIDVSTGATDTTLTTSVDVGTPMDGPGSDPEADPGCANYTPPEASADWYEFVVGASDRSKTLTWTVNGTTTDGFQVCFGAPYEFVALNSDGGLGTAPAGRLPDGTQGFVGLLAQCSEATAASPCVDGLENVTDPATGGRSVVATIEIPAGLQGDPWAAR